jgi:hypothetical protein
MGPFEILRAVLGIALVLFIPGFALTLALWPRTKGEVYREVLGVLAEGNVSRVFLLGEVNEDMMGVLRENSISMASDMDEADAVILTSEIGGDPRIPPDRTVVDLSDNLLESVKIQDTIDGIERTALSFGLSIALTPLIGLALDRTPYGIRTISVLVSLLSLTALFLVIYRVRRWRISGA